MEGTGETGSLAEREEFEPSVALERMVNLAKEPYGGYKETWWISFSSLFRTH
jgi:hypothetical protein